MSHAGPGTAAGQAGRGGEAVTTPRLLLILT